MYKLNAQALGSTTGDHKKCSISIKILYVQLSPYPCTFQVLGINIGTYHHLVLIPAFFLGFSSLYNMDRPI